MSEDEKREIVKKAIVDLKHEYIMVHKDQWRVYVVRTFAAIFLVGGVTFLAVLAVLWNSTTAATNAKIEKLLKGAKSDAKELHTITD